MPLLPQRKSTLLFFNVFGRSHLPLFVTDSDPTPSLALMDIQGPVAVTYGEVRVEKVEWKCVTHSF